MCACLSCLGGGIDGRMESAIEFDEEVIQVQCGMTQVEVETEAVDMDVIKCILN